MLNVRELIGMCNNCRNGSPIHIHDGNFMVKCRNKITDRTLREYLNREVDYFQLFNEVGAGEVLAIKLK